VAIAIHSDGEEVAAVVALEGDQFFVLPKLREHVGDPQLLSTDMAVRRLGAVRFIHWTLGLGPYKVPRLSRAPPETALPRKIYEHRNHTLSAIDRCR